MIKDLKVYQDNRGWLYEILRSDDNHFQGFGQSYLSATYPGIVKGFHKHAFLTDQMACVSGSIRLVLIEDSPSYTTIEEHILSASHPQLVIIPPNIWHGWVGLSEEPALILNIANQLYNPLQPDEVRVDAINNPWGYKWDIT